MQLPLRRVRSGDPQDCHCGHPALAHEHYRRGNDCALCECRRFKAATGRTRTSGDEGGPRREQSRINRAAA